MVNLFSGSAEVGIIKNTRNLVWYLQQHTFVSHSEIVPLNLHCQFNNKQIYFCYICGFKIIHCQHSKSFLFNFKVGACFYIYVK